MASLVPDKSVRSGINRITTWKLPLSEPDGYWMACSYVNSMTLLTKSLPKKVSTCRLTEQLLRSGVPLKITSFVCE